MEWSLSMYWGSLRLGCCRQALGWQSEKAVNASCPQFYSHKDLNTTLRLQEQIQYVEWKFIVESFKDVRQERKEYWFLTQWLGFEEPMYIMCQNVPKLSRDLMDSRELPSALNESISLNGYALCA